MYCKHCGNVLQPGERKCSRCGRTVLLYKDGTGFRDLLNPAACNFPAEEQEPIVCSRESLPSEPVKPRKKRPVIPLLMATNFILILCCLGLIITLLCREKPEKVPAAASEEATAAVTEVATAAVTEEAAAAVTKENTGAVTEESVISESQEKTQFGTGQQKETMPPIERMPANPPGNDPAPKTTVPVPTWNGADAVSDQNAKFT